MTVLKKGGKWFEGLILATFFKTFQTNSAIDASPPVQRTELVP